MACGQDSRSNWKRNEQRGGHGASHVAQLVVGIFFSALRLRGGDLRLRQTRLTDA